MSPHWRPMGDPERLWRGDARAKPRIDISRRALSQRPLKPAPGPPPVGNRDF
jgi:hypothetical protein